MDEPRLIAIHEASHGIIGRSHGLTVDLLTLQPPLCRFRVDRNFRLASPRQRALTTMAGCAAEAKANSERLVVPADGIIDTMFGRADYPVGGDEHNIARALRRMTHDAGDDADKRECERIVAANPDRRVRPFKPGR